MKRLTLVVTLLMPLFWGDVALANCFQTTVVGINEYSVQRLHSALGRLRCQTGPVVYEDRELGIQILRSNTNRDMADILKADEIIARQATELDLTGIERIFIIGKGTNEEEKCLLKLVWPEQAIFLDFTGKQMTLTDLCSDG